MRLAGALLLIGCVTLYGDGLPARSTVDQYPAKAEGKGLTIAADVIPPEQVRNEFSTSLVPNYQVLEVAIYPQGGSTVDLSTIDFALRVDGRLIRPAEPRTIAIRNQKQANRGGRDITLWPSVGVSTGTWGTGTNVGVGVGMGGRGPGPASTDRDRRVMETELDDRSLQDRLVDKPIAGYLYFPVGETKARAAELVYQQDSGDITLRLELPAKK
jgi:hypothetical protein